MYATYQRRYQQQTVTTASPSELVAKLYDLGVAACRQGDRARLRSVLVELLGSLNHEDGGELAGRLHAIYTFCLDESAMGDMDLVGDLLDGLRDSWREGVLHRKAA